MSGGYTRLTVQGAARKADVVLPDDEPVAALLPPLLDLLAEDRSGSGRPVTLTTLLGQQVDLTRTLAEQELAQGTLLRVVRVDQAPPPPEVADVTDVVAEALAERADRWQPVWGQAAVSAVAAATGWLAVTQLDRASATWAVVVATGLGAVLARLRRFGSAWALAAAASGGAVALAPMLDLALPTALTGWAVLGVVAAVVGGLGAGRVSAGLGGLTAVLLSAVVPVLEPMAGESGALAVAGVLAVLVLGVLPGVAMTASGLNGLDDRAVEGRRPGRRRVLHAVSETYRGLTWATVAAAGVVAVTGWSLVRGQGVWSTVLGGLLGLLVLLRARVLPLAPQRLALIAAGVAVAVGWALTRTPEAVLIGSAVVLLVAVVVSGLRTTGPLAARLRRLASVVELLAVLATVPLVLAMLGVFGDLVGTF
ncbi:EsaB/YukD family protein [Cellulomonas sp. NPDC089187]|uniref:EsaB/YukD family protein n=1 Tax=Cellulomonas sp. NPDC089187 TaxID=3154970 RepID=UPI00343BD014